MPTDADSPRLYSDVDKTASKADQKLLERIRTRFSYMTKAWKYIRDCAENDMRALGPDGPWDPAERKARQNPLRPRPCLHLDQLKQYPRSLVNQVRQNPQGVKVVPAGNGANDQTATLRGDRIRAIENECNGSQAYLTALQCAAERSYGVLTLETEEIAWDGWDQRIKIVREPDPDAILWDPDAKEADSSDMKDAFKVWQLPLDEFKRRYGKRTTVTDFNLESRVAPEWFSGERQTVQLARYSYFEENERHIYLVDDGSPKGRKVYEDDMPEGARARNGRMVFEGASYKILKEKDGIERHVLQCVTNGIELFDQTPWAGRWIPVFPMLGPESYTRIDGVVQRTLESYIRPAIDGQRAFDSAATNQLEAANMVPKIIYLGYKGQFSDTGTDWENINRVPSTYAEVNPIVDAATGQVLPKPERVAYDPPIQAMEVMKESNRRAIQAAIGSHGFTIADDTNVKSGKAVNALKAQSDVGSFHFIDSYQTTLRHVGRAIDDLLDKIEDTPRDVGLRKQNGKSELVRINEPSEDAAGQTVEHRYTPRDPNSQEPMVDAQHAVEIDTGPFGEAKRDEAREFLRALLASPMGPLCVDILAQIEDLGPFTDEIVKRLTPPQFQSKDGQAPVDPQTQQQLQQLGAQNQQLQQANQQLMNEKEAKVAELKSKEEIERLKGDVQKEIQRMKGAAAIAIAGISQKGQAFVTHEELTVDENIALAEQAHEAAMTQMGHDHQAAMAQQGQQAAADQSAQDHGQALEAGAVGHGQALQQQGQQAEAAAGQQAQEAQSAVTHRYNPESGAIEPVGAA